MPRTSKRALAVDALPDAQQAITYLNQQGKTDLAQAVETVVDYAKEAAEARIRAAHREAGLDRSYSLKVPEALKAHIQKVTTPGSGEITAAVYRRLQAFVDGTWTPDKPVRATRGQAADKGFINVRIPDEMAEAVTAAGKDPARVEERGYQLILRQVAVAALEAEYPLPEPKKSAKP